MRSLRGERGGILAISALIIPAILILTALVLDAGTWFTHKRSLQNRADAGALAAGVEYLSQLANCAANPTGPAAIAIADKARLYAGATAGAGYNETVNRQSQISVMINATGPTAADNSDGGNPCQDHDGDSISPEGGIWTDVIVRETDLNTVAGAFGINLPSIAARARVELGQITGVKGGLPFVNETGDQIECVWAQFVRARDGSTTGFSVLPSNPIELTKVPGTKGTWTGNVDHVAFTNAQDDVAIRYYAGSKDGNQPCTFSTPNKGPLPHAVDAQTPVSSDWLNVYSTGRAPAGPGDPPVLRQFRTTAGSCGGPGFLYTANTAPGIQCQLGFVAEVDTGVNNSKGQITVNPTQPTGGGIAPVSVPFDTTGGGGLDTVSGTILISPNATVAGSGYSQDYTQVGRTFLSVSWTQSQVNGAPCSGGTCSGTFQGETVAGQANNVQQAIYVADPLGSAPMTGSSTSLITNSFPAGALIGPFTLTFTQQAVDKEHIVLIRDSVNGPGSDKRTLAVWCGGSNSGASALQEAIEGGCQVPLTLNTRNDSCATPSGGWPTEPSPGPLDCIQVEQGNMTKIRAGFEDRFSCTPNNWVAGGPLPPDGDPRWAYIPLTGYGRMYAAANNDFIPIEGFIRIYIAGWGGKNFSGATGPNPAYPCRGVNDPPPRNFDGNGAQIWGHLANPITLDGAVVIGNAKCNLSLDNVQCKPTLVR